MKTLSIGRLVNDINILMDKYPVEGSEDVTKELITCSGGPANIVAYSLGKWNMESYISGVVGYDEIGNGMKKDMENNKIKTNYVEVNYDIKTPSSYILINKQSNSRTVISTEINNVALKKYEYDTDIDCVITDGSEYNASVYAFNKYSDALTILNAKTPQNRISDFFKYSKYVVASSMVAEALTGIKLDFENPISLTNAYKKIMDKYPHITLLITVEEKGTIYSINGEIKVLASMNTEIVDKTGARDIFVAMIGYGLVNGYDLETAIRLATIAESMSKKTIGATLSIPVLHDIIEYYESKFGKIKNSAPAAEVKPEIQEEVVVAEPNVVSNEIPKKVEETNDLEVFQVFGKPASADSESIDAPTA